MYMDKMKRRYGMMLAGAVVIAAAGTLGFAFASSARAGETAVSGRHKTLPPREMPESTVQRFADLKRELELPGQRSVRVREIIDSMTTTATAWNQMAPEVFETIMPLHEDSRWEVRGDTAFALGFIGLQNENLRDSAMKTLMKMTGDPAPGVRRTVARQLGALGLLGQPADDLAVSAMEALMKMSHDEDVVVRGTVADRIGALGRLPRMLLWIEARAVLDRLRQNDPDEKVRQVAEKHYSYISRLHPEQRNGKIDRQAGP